VLLQIGLTTCNMLLSAPCSLQNRHATGTHPPLLHGCHAGTVVAVVRIRHADAVLPQGVEECLICYSIIHPANGQLPRMACRTCAKRFHAACLYKWFQSAAKSNCPHCQTQWLHGRA